MGENRAKRLAEIRSLRLGLDLGMTLMDTAEMYGQGGAEEIVAEAIRGKREEVFLVSKVYPHNASLHGTVEACERSLRRLQTDHLDLYLLHWRGSIPLAETFESFESLKTGGSCMVSQEPNRAQQKLGAHLSRLPSWTNPGADKVNRPTLQTRR